MKSEVEFRPVDWPMAVQTAAIGPFGAASPDPNMKKRQAAKPPLSLIPLASLLPIAMALHDGNTRGGYKRNNWMEAVDFTIYEDALLRHIAAWQAGETYAPDSGVHHLAHAGANMLFLIWYHIVKARMPMTIAPQLVPPSASP